MDKILTYIAAEADDGQTLGTVLRSGLGLTARQVKQVKFLPDGLFINGERFRDGRLVTTRTIVRKDDHIRVKFQEKPETVVPFAGELAIVYEDEDIVFINKPAGLVAHPAHGHFFDTLANRLAARYEEPARLIGRLDKDTSGLIAAARNSVSATRMEDQRKDKTLSREYLALVQGKLQGKGRVEAPLAEQRNTLMKMVVDPEGKPAITDYKVWHSWQDCSLVWLRLQTGRTHQIRVHMSHIGHPLLGDSLYGEGAAEGMTRAALHSWRIRAKQPFTGAALEITALPPDDMKARWEIELMNELREYMERLTFPPEAVEALLPQMNAEIDVIAQKYMAEELEWGEALEQVKAMGEGEGYGRQMMLSVACMPELRRRYAEAGLDDELFWGIMMDLKYKLMECKNVKGEWGSFVAHWFDWHYKMKRFALGRLQFEEREWSPEQSYEKHGVVINKGDIVINMHIPSAGPLTEELRMDAYRRAYEFFADCYRDGKLVLVCNSWLLDPEYQTFLPETSNIVGFQKDFEILHVEKKENFGESWRIFGMPGDKVVNQSNAAEMPRDTSMQRAFADFLIGGGKTGTAFGVIVFDGKEILR